MKKLILTIIVLLISSTAHAMYTTTKCIDGRLYIIANGVSGVGITQVLDFQWLRVGGTGSKG